jgi:ribosomal protein S19E (S16A)
MSNYNKILENVEWLLDKYKNVIKEDNHLVLLYWKHFDKMNVTKETIPTQEFLRATNAHTIIDAYYLIQYREACRREEGNKGE